MKLSGFAPHGVWTLVNPNPCWLVSPTHTAGGDVFVEFDLFMSGRCERVEDDDDF